MELTPHCLAYFGLVVEPGPSLAQQAPQEEESREEALARLWSQIDQLTETAFYDELARLGLADAGRTLDEQFVLHRGAAAGSLAHSQARPQAGAASLDYEGLGFFESAYWQHRNSGAPRRSSSNACAKLKP